MVTNTGRDQGNPLLRRLAEEVKAVGIGTVEGAPTSATVAEMEVLQSQLRMIYARIESLATTLSHVLTPCDGTPAISGLLDTSEHSDLFKSIREANHMATQIVGLIDSIAVRVE